MQKFIAIVMLLSFVTVARAQDMETAEPLKPQSTFRGVVPQLPPNDRPKLKVGTSTGAIKTMTGSINRLTGSSTRTIIDERGENMKEKMVSKPLKNLVGSTTRKEIQVERKEIRQTARKDEAVAKKNALVKQLELTLNNLTKAKTSIASIIEKRVAEGKSVGNAQALLTVASTKIEDAKKAVASIDAWKPDTKTASSTEISLTKPRQSADAAIKAVKDARQAIDAVIKEVRSQGKKGNESATSTNQ